MALGRRSMRLLRALTLGAGVLLVAAWVGSSFWCVSFAWNGLLIVVGSGSFELDWNTALASIESHDGPHWELFGGWRDDPLAVSFGLATWHLDFAVHASSVLLRIPFWFPLIPSAAGAAFMWSPGLRRRLGRCLNPKNLKRAFRLGLVASMLSLLAWTLSVATEVWWTGCRHTLGLYWGRCFLEWHEFGPLHGKGVNGEWASSLGFGLSLPEVRFPNTPSVIEIPFWIIFLSIALPTLWSWRRLRRFRPPGQCTNCGYDLRASKGKCPECGTRPEVESR